MGIFRAVKSRHAQRLGGLAALIAAGGLAVGFAGSSRDGTTIDFEQYAPGTVITNQYAGAGGTGNGVVFGPLPGGAGDGFRPVVRQAPAGQSAHSGSNIADISTCTGCEFVVAKTTGTFVKPRSRVSVYVGYLGDAGRCFATNPAAEACAFVTLRTFDIDGQAIGEATARLSRGAGVGALLSLETPTAAIDGFEIVARKDTDIGKAIAIDDLAFGSPAAAAPADFTLNPAATSLGIDDGRTVTDTITIGRLNGSAGNIMLRADGLPEGVSATFSPNPASGGQTTLSLTATPIAPPGAAILTITGTPASAAAGSSPHAFQLGIQVSAACPHVSTAKELIDNLAAGFKCIYVNDSATIDLSANLSADFAAHPELTDDESVLVIPDGVTLMGGRGPTALGGMLELSRRGAKKIMLKLASNTRVSGLRLHGYNESDTRNPPKTDETRAIAIPGSSHVVISGNEIDGWPQSGVYVTDAPALRAADARVTRNFIHNNLECSEGQGVQISDGGFALIDHNLFVDNRHDVGSLYTGRGYIAELNFNLTSGPTCHGALGDYYNQHYDMHGEHGGYDGTAGTFMEILLNTIRGAQNYGGVYSRPAFWLRGTPIQKAIFAYNVVHSEETEGRKGAVRIGKTGFSDTDAGKLMRHGKLEITGNKLCTDTASELGVGDFNGDGHADVFQSVGTLWVYSPSGSREWQILNDSSIRLAKLGLGDFNGDGKTDVFTQAGSHWFVSSGGTGPLTALPVGSTIPISTYHFADFNGDHRTDVFRASGTQFFISSAAGSPWQPLATSRFTIKDLRFGDFNGDGKTDVFSLANSQWSVSDGGVTDWRRLNAKLASSLDGLVFADFNGDRHTDIARESGGKWQVSWGGTTPWQVLQYGRIEGLDDGMLLADFTGDGHDDVLQYGASRSSHFQPCWARGDFLSFEYYNLSPSGNHLWVAWSSAKMR